MLGIKYLTGTVLINPYPSNAVISSRCMFFKNIPFVGFSNHLNLGSH